MFGPAERYALDTLDALEHFDADVVVSDYFIPGVQIGAEKAGLPCAALMHHPYAFPAPGIPPFGLGLAPGRTWFGRLRDRALRAFVMRSFNRLGLAPINAARSALGLPTLPSVFDQALRVARILVMTTPGFDFASKAGLPEHVRYVGPTLDDPAWTDPYPDRPSASGDAPLVLVGLGSTFQNQREVTQRVVDALGQLPVRGLVTLGNVFGTEELRAPGNVELVRSAPHNALLPRARVAVAHAGHGTVMKALSHGVPLLCLPLGRDQRDNALRVTLSGAGLSLQPSASVDSIRAALTRLLGEPPFRAAARTLADEIQDFVAADACVHELEALAGVAVAQAAESAA
jgi:UDP:flavonoid glycosyltransferase YjiC (YdhE family)